MSKPAAENWILRYYQAIEDGSVTVGHWIRLLYERIISDLENKVYFFDQKKANKAVRFIEKFCHHSKGKLAPKLVKLEVWQKAMISCIFGLVDENGVRVYREIFVVMGRKNGKSLLASGIAEYMTFADGERGADCFFLAPKLEQADIVKYFAKAKTEDAGIFRKRREWMLDHCSRLIAYCNGTPGGTWTTIEDAVDRKMEIITNIHEMVEEYREGLAKGGGRA